MEKRGSRYLRYALYNATKYVCLWDPTFSAYLAKKLTEGKHYNVALSHASKKLVRLIFAMEKSRQPYRIAPLFRLLILLVCAGVLPDLYFAIPFFNHLLSLPPPSLFGVDF